MDFISNDSKLLGQRAFLLIVLLLSPSFLASPHRHFPSGQWLLIVSHVDVVGHHHFLAHSAAFGPLVPLLLLQPQCSPSPRKAQQWEVLLFWIHHIFHIHCCCPSSRVHHSICAKAPPVHGFFSVFSAPHSRGSSPVHQKAQHSSTSTVSWF